MVRQFRYLDALTTTFAGTYSPSKLFDFVATAYLLKVPYEVLATPLTYLIVNFLKRAEHADAFDAHTNFNPFRFMGNSAASKTPTEASG